MTSAAPAEPCRVGFYAGAFDPIHNGHVDIIERAIKLVDRLVVGVAVDPDKHLFSLEERIGLVEETVVPVGGPTRIQIVAFQGLATTFARRVGASIMVRDLRAAADFETSFQITAMNQKLDPEIETLFLMACPSHQAISSKLVKEIASLNGDVSPFVSSRVVEALRR